MGPKVTYAHIKKFAWLPLFCRQERGDVEGGVQGWGDKLPRVWTQRSARLLSEMVEGSFHMATIRAGFDIAEIQ